MKTLDKKSVWWKCRRATSTEVVTGTQIGGVDVLGNVLVRSDTGAYAFIPTGLIHPQNSCDNCDIIFDSSEELLQHLIDWHPPTES
jgi:hypothetical protein